jgi:hypothetical protein
MYGELEDFTPSAENVPSISDHSFKNYMQKRPAENKASFLFTTLNKV